MSTFLFDKTIFGPIRSRRLGISLGVNLLPNDRKICSFDCLYCECGFGQKSSDFARMPKRDEVKEQLRAKLTEMKNEGELPDVITFAGNGEPTLHPDFAGVIDDTIALRNEFCPSARVAVLSNASRLGEKRVVEALRKVDDNILKIDSAFDKTAIMLDRPNYAYSVEKVIEQTGQFADNMVIQTMFVKWSENGCSYDNSTDEEVEAWLSCLRRINPPRVMIYTIDRDTPHRDMQKVAPERLDAIAVRAREIVGNVSVSY
ncbi:MAG: radical SAM protein [Bacteroidales bacterium]|nr:radical SAM protein [Bacteroidales bacterium]